LITSKTRLKLLTKFFLNQETQAYLQELATEFGESSNGIRVELNRLSDAKLLKSKASGRTVLYRANQKHPLFQAIQGTLLKNIGIDRVVADIVEQCGQIESAWIIGDYSKGVDSGLIDLVVLGRVDWQAIHLAIDKTSRMIKRKIRLLVINRTELENLHSRLDLDRALPIWGDSKPLIDS
jgi:hypothetical protein